MTKHSHFVSKKEKDERIDKLLTNVLKDHSRSSIQKLIQQGRVTVNQQKIKANYRCQENDHIEWTFPPKKELTIQPENLPLKIVYEDEDIIIVNKPKGMVVHPTKAHLKGTLVNGLLHYTKELSTIGGKMRPGIVHRIDKETSGLLVIAKNNNAHKKLSRQFQTNKIKRFYEAIVYGVLPHNKGKIDAPIGRDPHNRLRRAVVKNGRESITYFQVIQRFPKYTYIACELKTGRTHQIRVHMSHLGHPVVGDLRYAPGRLYTNQGQALYAKKLFLIHPRTKKRMHFEIEPPSHFKKILLNIEKET